MQIGRIEYTGSCRPDEAASIASRNKPGKVRVQVSGLRVDIEEAGPHLVRVHDFGGRVIETLRGEGPMSHSLARGRPKGIYFVTVEIPAKATQTFAITDL